MNKFKVLISKIPDEFLVIFYILVPIIFSGVLFAIVVFTSTAIDQRFLDRRFCFTNSCVTDFLLATSQSLVILKATLDSCVAIATIGGIFIALQSYLTSANNGALINHIEHLKVFREYLDSEINKRDLISKSKIDDLVLYGLIFENSRQGLTSVSNKYVDFVIELNRLIHDSNAEKVEGKRGGFDHRRHQHSMCAHLNSAGVSLTYLPENRFFEVENQIFSLLDRVGQSFCEVGRVPKIETAHYQ